MAHAVKTFDGPVFHLCQGYEADFSFNVSFKAEIEAAYMLPTHKLAVSHHVADRLKSLGYKPVSYVGQTFDPDEFPPAVNRKYKSYSPTILLPGIFESDVKGIRESLEVLAQLRQEQRPFQLLRVSTWPQSESEKAILPADKYSVRLSPPEMAAAYQTSDLMIGPSHPEEGFGLHVLEALSSGLPVLISDTPGHRHIARQAAEYFKWHERQDLLLKLKNLLQNPLRLRELSRMGPLEACRFSTAKVAAKLITLFNQSME
ncbi:glycosyltransferase, group 1 family protein [delta proteobacterium NaphS2]|nr:glycosyltransferase, group 1 family protein [delta proteobacterium NaphS2]